MKLFYYLYLERELECVHKHEHTLVHQKAIYRRCGLFWFVFPLHPESQGSNSDLKAWHVYLLSANFYFGPQLNFLFCLGFVCLRGDLMSPCQAFNSICSSRELPALLVLLPPPQVLGL